jgi:deazaflavin-dependent oxidoreductase (nitroreductase family)
MNDFNTALIENLRANDGHASGGPFAGRQVLILTTTGARTGERRASPLAYSRDGDDIVIVASKGGAPTHPAWFHNIVAHPSVTIEVDGKTMQATAHVADDEERRRLYDQHAALHPGFKDYEGRTDRIIPVIVLHPEAVAAAA